MSIEESIQEQAALRGVPSIVWRAGQERRLNMIVEAAGDRVTGTVFVDGCGLGMYVEHLAPLGGRIYGLDIDLERVQDAGLRSPGLVCGVGEHLPFPDNHFDLVLSHEVLEHVQDDRLAVQEIVRTLKPGGRLAVFVPNRGYPFETHGVYWRGRYRFGNIPLVNYLPRAWRNRLAPHVRVYSRADLERLFRGLPVRFVQRTVIFGAYDNIIARRPGLGRLIRGMLQTLETTPLRGLGLSHFWVVEKL
jgi:SAM-dependent methyltransferase